MAYAHSRDEQTPSSAVGEAYDYLRRRIRDGQLQSGVRIKAEEVAAELGISRMPVREAIRQLDTEGLVTIRPNRGAVVTRLSPDEILEVFEMRAALEGIAIRRAIPRFNEDKFEEIGLILSRLDRARPDIDQWILRHSEFHDFICQQSSAYRLCGEVQRLRAAVEPYLRMVMLQSELASGSTEEHRQLIEVIRAGHEETAERVMRTHILETAHELIAALAPPVSAAPGAGAKRSRSRA
jgi:DNA-binding GntR family transcriptional regulator